MPSHGAQIYIRLQRVDVIFSIVYPDSDNEFRPVQERRILYLDLADYERLRLLLSELFWALAHIW